MADPTTTDVRVEEQPVLDTLDHAVICLHFVDNPHDFLATIRNGRRIQVGDREDFRYCSVVCSMELDLISYKFQDDDLVKTNLIYDTIASDSDVTDVCHCLVDVHFPSAIAYTSEGRTQWLVPPTSRSGAAGDETAAGEVPPLRCEARLARTYFKKSGIVVWNLVLRAAGGAFNEYDLIKLMHLYEGKSENAELYDSVTFDVSSAGRPLRRAGLPADDLLPAVWECLAGDKFRDAYHFAAPFASVPDAARETPAARNPRRPRGASVQVAVGPNIGRGGRGVSLEEALGQVYAARRDKGVAAPARSHRHRTRWALRHALERSNGQAGYVDGVLKALAGITNGIFDFKEVGDEEIRDTLDPTFSSGANFIKVHRRTLVNILSRDRVLDEVSDTLGISPYVMLPHVVIIHNEELIDRVDESMTALANAKRIRLLEHLKDLSVKAMLGMYIPNIFNYVTEKTLYERAFEVRGSSVKRSFVLERMHDLDQRVAQAYEKRRSRHDAIVSGMLFFLATAPVLVLLLPDGTIPTLRPLYVGFLGLLFLALGVVFIALSRR